MNTQPPMKRRERKKDKLTSGLESSPQSVRWTPQLLSASSQSLTALLSSEKNNCQIYKMSSINC